MFGYWNGMAGYPLSILQNIISEWDNGMAGKPLSVSEYTIPKIDNGMAGQPLSISEFTMYKVYLTMEWRVILYLFRRILFMFLIMMDNGMAGKPLSGEHDTLDNPQ